MKCWIMLQDWAKRVCGEEKGLSEEVSKVIWVIAVVVVAALIFGAVYAFVTGALDRLTFDWAG
ncbi:MAG: hypothetical protein LBI99_08745 [Propionibacteriaceae bacterium]|nr:hypothetical protein [Propionibacteriaceae bacterium]